MKKPLLFLLLSIAAGMISNAATVTVSNSGLTFSPAAITINEGDSVRFTISSTHNVREVSQATYQANGSTALSGGFSLPFGGGLLLPAQLTVGMHYYVCSPHAGAGMKGTIDVLPASGISTPVSAIALNVFPVPAKDVVHIVVPQNHIGRLFSVSDMTGRLVYEGVFLNEENAVDITRWPKGIYLLRSEDTVVRVLKD
ncbi:MAG: hypothetical protein RL021_1752 [Bacteroidota bacterium]|jgi:plastocyanin